MPESKSQFIGHQPCGACGSKDANSLYDDGHTFCFSCGAIENGATGTALAAPALPKDGAYNLPDDAVARPLKARKIRGDACEALGYFVTPNGLELAVHRDDKGGAVGAKVRGYPKSFSVKGNLRPLWPMHKWSSGKHLVITEGELDALTVYQAFGCKWPVVSLANGAQGAPKAIAKALPWLAGFSTVTLMFDGDEPGRDAADACAALLPPGQAFVAAMPDGEDPNSLLCAGRVADLTRLFWDAHAWRPQGIVVAADYVAEATTPLPDGAPWPWQGLTDITHGRRPGELIGIGAAQGAGKSSLIAEIVAFDLARGERVGMISFEQSPAVTVRQIGSVFASKRLHAPGVEVPEGTYDDWPDRLEILNAFGVSTWADVATTLRYWSANGIKFVTLDHLTALASPEDERRSLDELMRDLASLVLDLKLSLVFVSHLATPSDGKDHSEGASVKAGQFRGSRAISFWAHYLFGLTRNQVAEDEEERRVLTVKVLKDRPYGRSGHSFELIYDFDTGRLSEYKREDTGYGF